MKKFSISKTRRLRVTPFTSRLEKYGVGGYTVYNHMLLPTFFNSMEEEYQHLKNFVQLWDVSVQREIEVTGKDSYKLIQLMTCRDLSNAKIKKCYYVPLIDKNGNMINDPLVLKLDETKWRICIADSDVILFAKGIADTLNLEVNIHETNISTLAVQGPKSEQLLEKVFGKKIVHLKFFNFDYFDFNGVKHMISKSGFSKQGGYEIHIENINSGLKLYDHLFIIGKEFNVKPGCPNAIERIEGALLSYGNDMDNNDNPFECGFEKYVNIEADINFLGKDKLKKIQKDGIKRKLMGVQIDINKINLTKSLNIKDEKGNLIGDLRSACYSPHFKKSIGIAMINEPYCKASATGLMEIDGNSIAVKVCDLPFI